MSKIYTASGFGIDVKRDEIARCLGYGQKQVPPRVATALDEVEKTAPALIETACSYRMMTSDEYFHSHYVCHIGALAVCLVTIGPKLEARVDELKAAGDLSGALILDSYGSAAAEAAAEAAEGIVRTKVAESGLKCSPRFSPGYGGWNVAEQKWVFAAVDGGALGVKLTEGCMLVPRKSITFAMTIGDQPVDMRDAEVCEYCGMVKCRFRPEGKP